MMIAPSLGRCKPFLTVPSCDCRAAAIARSPRWVSPAWA